MELEEYCSERGDKDCDEISGVAAKCPELMTLLSTDILILLHYRICFL